MHFPTKPAYSACIVYVMYMHTGFPQGGGFGLGGSKSALRPLYPANLLPLTCQILAIGQVILFAAFFLCV